MTDIFEHYIEAGELKCPNDKAILIKKGPVSFGVQRTEPCSECGYIWLYTIAEDLYEVFDYGVRRQLG